MITGKLETVLSYYTQPGAMCGLGGYSAQVRDEIPGDVPSLVRTPQGLVLHVFWAERYGVKLPEDRQVEVQIRRVVPKLDRLFQLDPRPLDCARTPELRLVGNILLYYAQKRSSTSPVVSG